MLKLNEKGLIPAIVQDAASGRVLMLGYMDAEALRRTLEQGQVWFYSRSRGELWHKGATSGSYLNLRSIVADCDEDALLLRVEATGPACHTGAQSCFFNEVKSAETQKSESQGASILDELYRIILERKALKPQGSYVAGLLEGGIDRISKKVIEEAGEAVIAAKNAEAQPLAAEVADLWFHSLVLLAASGLEPEDVWRELRARRK